MQNRAWTGLGVLSVTGLISLGAQAGGPSQAFEFENPGVRMFRHDGELRRIYGAPFSTGDSIEQSAAKFIQDYAKSALGAEPGELKFVPASDEWAIQPLMYNATTGEFKFYALHFEQEKFGVPVHESRLTLVVRNEENYPLVLASVHNIADLSDIDVAGGGNGIAFEHLTRDMNVVGAPRTVIFNDKARGEGELRLAYQFIVQHGQPGQPVTGQMNFQGTRESNGTYDRRMMLMDAQTGEVLKDASVVRTIDVQGNVAGLATPGLEPDTGTNTPVSTDLPNVTVEILGGNESETDIDGNFVIPHGGSSAVTVRSEMRGPSLSQGINDLGGGELLIDLNVTPPGPADFLHNASPTQFDTAEVNTMLHTSLVHTFLGDINPSYPGLNRAFTANTNITSTCNAFYDGVSINFYREGGGCVNTAYSTVVYHEYGHKIVDDGASFPSGDYHEGMADCVSMILADDPVVGEGFSGPGTNVRSGINNRTYPCGGAVHFCGQVMSGSVWDTRDALEQTEPTQYLDIIQSLTINQIAIHSGGIDPGITIDFLTLDDDDANLDNGTPHYDEINLGFGNHGMPAPPLIFVDFNYPNGLPDTISPNGNTVVRVEVTPNVTDPVPGSGLLYYDDGSGYQSIPMQIVSDDVYDAVFPSVECATIVDYYFAVDTTDAGEATDPAGAPLVDGYNGFSASAINDVFVDDFEADLGWSVENISLEDGGWNRGVPVGGGDRGDPASDFDGSGACYLTDNVDGNSDVDGGPTRLTSPIFDATGGDNVFVSYARWFTNDDNDGDRLTVEISNDAGSNWTTLESVGNTPGWEEANFNIGDFVTPTSQMQVRFSATDNPNDSVTEAAIDAFTVSVILCDAMVLEATPLNGGQPATLTATDADPGAQVYFVYSLSGTGSTFVPQLGVTLGLSNPQLAGSAIADGSGVAQFSQTLPNVGPLVVWLQAAHNGKVSNVLLTQIN